MHPRVFIIGGACGSINPSSTQGGTLAVGGPSQLTSNRSSHLHRIINHIWIFDLHSAGCSKLAEWAVVCHELWKTTKIVQGKMQQQSKSMRGSAPRLVNRNNEILGGQCPDPSMTFIAAVEIARANQDVVINHPCKWALRPNGPLQTCTISSSSQLQYSSRPFKILSHNQIPMHEGDAFGGLCKMSRRIGSLGLIL
jgi:hypothetical protein